MTAQLAGLAATNLLIGIDDTDNLDSKGTGNLAQRLLAALEAEEFGQGIGATRHRLLVDPQIAYTSHNSSACLAWRTDPGSQPSQIPDFAGDSRWSH
ncbi:MAG TPA: hypothetical protein VIJ69_08545 [Actinomycetota bacterium]